MILEDFRPPAKTWRAQNAIFVIAILACDQSLDPCWSTPPAETEFARRVSEELLDPERMERRTEPLSGSEDFPFMLEAVPDSYLPVHRQQ